MRPDSNLQGVGRRRRVLASATVPAWLHRGWGGLWGAITSVRPSAQVNRWRVFFGGDASIPARGVMFSHGVSVTYGLYSSGVKFNALRDAVTQVCCGKADKFARSLRGNAQVTVKSARRYKRAELR